jgi:hypothetical protein
VKWYVLALIDTNGPVPVVVNVNTYSEHTPTHLIGTYWWKLAEADTRGGAEKLAKVTHPWAEPWIDGEIRLPHFGR